MAVTVIPNGDAVVVRPGDHFVLWLPDGTVLNVEQTRDDFSITHAAPLALAGVVAYTRPTSAAAVAADGVDRDVVSGCS